MGVFEAIGAACMEIWPLFLVGGGVYGMFKAVNGLVKRQVSKGLGMKVDKEDFEEFKKKNSDDHHEMKETLAHISGKIDVLLRNNGGGRDG